MTDESTETAAKIRVRNLTRVFGDRPELALSAIRENRTTQEIHESTGQVAAVREASFEVREGEVFIVMGLSGSGKSTLVRMLNRLIEPTGGEVCIDNQNILEMSRRELIELRRRDIAMVFQHFALMPHLTNLENAAFGLDIAGVTEPERSRRVNRALETVGLSEFADNHPYELSGGMQQRVGLARALSLEPTIMLLDEAFSALDPLIRTEMQDELLKIQRASNITVVFISHDLREALRIGDRLAIMQAGEIVQIGTPRELILQPANDYVRSFLGDVDKRQVLTAADLVEAAGARWTPAGGSGPRQALEYLDAHGGYFLYVTDSDGRYRGVVSRDSLRNLNDIAAGEGIDRAFLDGAPAVSPAAGFYDLIEIAVSAPCPVPVVDDDTGTLEGVIPHAAMLKGIHSDSGGA